MVAECRCRQCLRDRGENTTIEGMRWPVETIEFVVCSTCGNKRCPHATDHRLCCTCSNEPGQEGSIYGVPLRSQMAMLPFLGEN